MTTDWEKPFTFEQPLTMREPALSRVQKVFWKQFFVDAPAVIPGAALSDLLDDSLAKTEFVLALEEEFGVRISDKVEDAMLTVDDALQFLEARGIT